MVCKVTAGLRKKRMNVSCFAYMDPKLDLLREGKAEIFLSKCKVVGSVDEKGTCKLSESRKLVNVCNSTSLRIGQSCV